MKDPRLIRLRLAADRDRRLSNAGSRLFSLVVNVRYISPDHPEDDFPLTWKLPHSFLGWSSDTAYRALEELVALGYLQKTRICGSPPKAFYRFVMASAEPAPNCRKNAAIDCRKNAADKTGKNAANLTSIPFRKELNQRKEFERGVAARKEGGRNGAASPRGDEGESNSGASADYAAAIAAEFGVTVEEMAAIDDERKRWMHEMGKKAASRRGAGVGRGVKNS